MRIGLHVKYPLFLLECNETLIFSTFSKNSEISNVMNIMYYLFVPICNNEHKYKSWISFQWELRCSVRTDWWRELTKVIVDLRNFANLPKSLILLSGIEPGLRGRPARWPLSHAHGVHLQHCIPGPRFTLVFLKSGRQNTLMKNISIRNTGIGRSYRNGAHPAKWHQNEKVRA